MKSKTAMAAGLLCVLAGCDLPPVQNVAAVRPSKTYHDVAYYDAHPLERSATKSWCGDNPGLAGNIANCDSADTSSIHAWHRQMGWQ